MTRLSVPMQFGKWGTDGLKLSFNLKIGPWISKRSIVSVLCVVRISAEMKRDVIFFETLSSVQPARSCQAHEEKKRPKKQKSHKKKVAIKRWGWQEGTTEIRRRRWKKESMRDCNLAAGHREKKRNSQVANCRCPHFSRAFCFASLSAPSPSAALSGGPAPHLSANPL